MPRRQNKRMNLTRRGWRSIPAAVCHPGTSSQVAGLAAYPQFGARQYCAFLHAIRTITPGKGRLRGRDKEGRREKVKTGIVALALLVNAVALFCVVNPWVTAWQGAGIVVLAVEAAAVVAIGAPVFFYRVIREKKPWRQSLEETMRLLMDFLAGWV